MYRSGLFNKSPTVPENSSGRNNICNRFPVGITSMGDDNQNIRIQLAIHKYNSSSNSPTYNKHSLISPTRHSISKNLSKAKNYELELDCALKSEYKSGNRYEGVGSFPVVHLEKSSILHRPIKRFFKKKGISYPEIPENRFLNHTQKLYSNPKPNTRSVLDVLQDLSRKRIHSKTENNYYKKSYQGLGGDAATNGEIAYKPLFIKKDKILPIPMKDNTTQTILPYFSNKTSVPDTVSSLIKNDRFDPKAELRKKLAKQNNEIFASLSSSISPLFSLKRKIDKIAKCQNESRNEILSTKKQKLLDKQKNNCEENDINVNSMETNTNDFLHKINLKNKFKIKSATSPSATNKDRLTTIFLDMQNENSTAQIFKTFSTLTEIKNSMENNAYNLNKTLAQTNRFSEDIGDKQKNTINGNLHIKQSVATEPKENQNSNSYTFQYPLSKSNNLTLSGIASNINSSSSQDNIECSKYPNFNVNTFLKSSDRTSQSISLNTTAMPNSSTIFNFSDKSNAPDDGVYVSPSETLSIIKQKSDAGDKESVSKQFVFEKFSENEINKSDLNSPAHNISQLINSNTKSTNPILTLADNLPQSDAIQFSFGIKNNINTTSINSLTPIPISSNLNLSNTVSTLLLSSENPKFTFEKLSNSLENYNETEIFKNNLTIPSTTFSQSPTVSSLICQNSKNTYFAPGKESLKDNHVDIADGGQNKTENIQIQMPINCSSTNSDSLKKDSLTSFQLTNTTPAQICSTSEVLNHNKPFPQTLALVTVNKQNNENSLFCNSSNQKFTNIILSNNVADKSNINTLIDQKKQPSLSFNFVQNSETESKGSSLEKNNQPNLFSVIQESEEKSCKNNNCESSYLIQTPDFFQKSSNLVTQSNLNSSIIFGQNNSQNSQEAKQSSSSNQTKNSDTTNSFGIKNETTSFGPMFGQTSSSFSSKTSIFGINDNKVLCGIGFGLSNNQPNTIFGISTTSTSSQSTTCAGFGIPSMGFVNRCNNSFGITTTPQPSNNFGISTTTQPTFTFGTSTTTQASNALSATTTSQSTSTFGLSTTAHLNNIFGLSANQLNNVFSASTTQPTNAFLSNTTKLTNTFGSAATAQCNAGFGITSSPPFGQSFLQNPIKTTPGQQAVNIFGQNTATSNTVSNAFNLPTNSSFNSSTANNIFGQKSNNEQGSVQALKTQASPFRQTPVSQSFNVGMSTSNVTGFTTSPPNTTTSTVFTFGTSSQGPAFNFGNNLSNNISTTSSPFAFHSRSNDNFKLNISSSKEGSAFSGNNTSTFTFGGQMNNNTPMTIKPTEPTFNFGSGQDTSTPSFNFSSHSTSPVFSFGGSGSITGSSSTFNFGTPQTGGSFGQPTPSPVATFSAPGTFSIGSGSSQSRQKASSRLRRRP